MTRRTEVSLRKNPRGTGAADEALALGTGAADEELVLGAGPGVGLYFITDEDAAKGLGLLGGASSSLPSSSSS